MEENKEVIKEQLSEDIELSDEELTNMYESMYEHASDDAPADDDETISELSEEQKQLARMQMTMLVDELIVTSTVNQLRALKDIIIDESSRDIFIETLEAITASPENKPSISRLLDAQRTLVGLVHHISQENPEILTNLMKD